MDKKEHQELMGERNLTPEILAPYLQIEHQQSIKPASSYTQEVMDYYILGEDKTGKMLPCVSGDKFRLRNGECTLLGGINSSGKSLVLGQLALYCMTQKSRVLSVSLEMSVRSQLVRMWRMASGVIKPDLDFGLKFNKWSHDKLFFFDKMGSMDLNTLEAGIRYAIHHFGTDLILVDSLMTISGIRHDDYTAQTDVVCRLADIARDLECHIILVAHARKSFSVNDKIDRFSVRGAGQLTDRVDNVILLQRNYPNNSEDPDVTLTISKARHWDMAECEINLWMDMASMNLLTANQSVYTIIPDDFKYMADEDVDIDPPDEYNKELPTFGEVMKDVYEDQEGHDCED
jgi:twinkle protein